jgi:MOSC domain-containing protein YiiM
MMNGKIVSINISDTKSVKKKPVKEAALLRDKGIDGDVHAEGGIRQVSLLAIESIRKMRAMGLDVHPGDFAENITTEGVDLLSLPVGMRVKIGKTLLEVSQHGKVCHTKCDIFKAVGDCVMPKEGIFCRVLTGGSIKIGDLLTTVEQSGGEKKE